MNKEAYLENLGHAWLHLRSLSEILKDGTRITECERGLLEAFILEVSRPRCGDFIDERAHLTKNLLDIGIPLVEGEVSTSENTVLHETTDHSAACRMGKIVIVPMAQNRFWFFFEQSAKIFDVASGSFGRLRCSDTKVVQVCNVLIKRIESFETVIDKAGENRMGSTRNSQLSLEIGIDTTGVDEELHEILFAWIPCIYGKSRSFLLAFTRGLVFGV